MMGKIEIVYRRSLRSLILVALALSSATVLMAEESPTGQPAIRRHAEETFRSTDPPGSGTGRHSDEEMLIGHGQGDLGKGSLVCLRVSELAARADLAKQIRVLIKEHATDRMRERTGREPEQDIEVIREEIVQEYLEGVRIVDRHLDEAHKTCSATAVMPKHQIPSNSAPNSAAPASMFDR